MTTDFNGKPDAGNPHVRFDEGANVSAKPRRGAALLNTTKRNWLALAMLGAIAAQGARLTSQSYVQDGMITQFDAIENVGVGQSDAAASQWKDLKGNAVIPLVSGTAWIARALDASTQTLQAYSMPAFDLGSVATEVSFNRLSNGPSGKYPRVFKHPDGDGVWWRRMVFNF